MKRILLILALIVATAVAAQAQAPIKWRMTVKMTSQTEGVVTLRAVLDAGWHLYGTSLPKGGPKPTAVDFSASQGVKFTSDLKPDRAAAKHHDDMFGLDLSWWDANVTFTRSFKLVKPEGAKITATISFMGCNDANCLPPQTSTLTYTFKK